MRQIGAGKKWLLGSKIGKPIVKFMGKRAALFFLSWQVSVALVIIEALYAYYESKKLNRWFERCYFGKQSYNLLQINFDASFNPTNPQNNRYYFVAKARALDNLNKSPKNKDEEMERLIDALKSKEPEGEEEPISKPENVLDMLDSNQTDDEYEQENELYE